MKRGIILIFAAAVLGLPAQDLHSRVDLSYGANAWYTSWMPAWRDGSYRSTGYAFSTGNYSVKEIDLKNIRNLNFPMYGGSLALRVLDRVSVSSVFMYGTVSKKTSCISPSLSIIPPQGIDELGYHTYRRDIKKWDSDSVIGISLLPSVSVIAGFKAQGYSFHEFHSNMLFTSNYYIRQSRDKSNSALGPGLGLSFNIPLHDLLFLQLNATGIVMRGKEETPRSLTAILRYNGILSAAYLFPINGSYTSYGGSSSLALAYRFPETGITLSLGFRYQFLHYRQDLQRGAADIRRFINNDVFDKVDGKNDHFYGATFSVVHTVSFGRKPE